MKRLKWFAVGESIPDDARYIKSGPVQVGTTTEWDPHGGSDETPVIEERHLYEIRCPANEPERYP